MLTIPKIDSLKPKEKVYLVKDSDNLFIRVSLKGKKNWVASFTVNSKRKRVDVGVYPATSASEARTKRDHIVSEAVKGIDATLKKREEKSKKHIVIVSDVNALIDEFIQRDLNKNRLRPEQPIRVLNHDVRHVIGKYLIADITRVHINRVLDPIVERGAPVVANRLSSLLGQLFDYAISRGYVENNPAFGLKKRSIGGNEKPRERVLTWLEIKGLLVGLADIPSHDTFKNILRMALATGQRISTICGAFNNEFDFDKKLWHIPKASGIRKTKSNYDRELPLTDHVIAIINRQRQINQSNTYLFETINDPLKPCDYNSVMSVLRRNNELLGCPAAKDERYTLHDLRRTFATLVNELAIDGRHPDPYIIEMILGHRLKLTSTSHIYNRASYSEQQLEVLNVWSDRLALIEANQSNVELLTANK